jgi:hypothetical protein
MDPSLIGQRRRDLDKSVRNLLVNTFHTVSHVPGMEVFKQPAVVEMQVEDRVRPIRRFL